MPAPLYGQVLVNATAQVLSTQPQEMIAFTIKAPLSNTNPVWIGDQSVTTSTGHQLDPGDELTYERVSQNGQPQYVLRPSDFWAVGVAPDRLTWLGSP